MLTARVTDGFANFSDSLFDWSIVGPATPNRSIELGQGICLPASCSPEKVVEYANKVFEGDNLKASAAKCRTNDPVEVKFVDIFAL